MFQLQTFGAVDLRNSTEQSVQSVLAQPRRTALLLYLAAASPQRFHRRDSLLALFWPESDAAQGRAALSQAIYFLRRSLSESVVVSRGKEEVSIDAAHLRCDAVLFEEALQKGRKEEALALYRGDFLEGFHVSEAPQFEQWAETERARLKAQALSAAVGLSAEKQAAGDLNDAMKWARRAQTIAPAEEAAVRQLVSLLAEIGERSEAIREYQVFAERIRVEFDLEPSPGMQALIAQLCSQEMPALRATLPLEPRTPATISDTGVDAPEESLSVATTAMAAGYASPRREAPARRRGGLRHLTGWIAGGGCAAAVALLAALSFSPNAERATLDENRVLVASLDNLTGDASLDVLGDMAADWITQGLQQTELVQVIDPTSALVASRSVASDSVRPQGIDRIVALAERSGAGVIVLGAIYRQGDSLHFRTRVVNARDRTLLRTLEPITASAGDPIRGVEQLRTRVAGTFASMLDRRVASLSTAQGRAPSFEAYREYILGLEPFQRRRYEEALPHFESAARLDTTFMLPRFWAAFAYGNSGNRPGRDSVIQEVAARRHRLSPLDQYSLDYFLARDRGDIAAALEATRKAARLSPGSNWSFLAGNLALGQNRPNEALRYLHQVDPERGWARGWTGYWKALADTHHYLGQHEEELLQAQRAVRLDPEDSGNRTWEIRALIALGRLTEAEERLGEVLALPPDIAYATGEMLSGAAFELQAHGHSEKAREISERIVEWSQSSAAEHWIRTRPTAHAREKSRHLIAGRLGQALVRLGRLDEARAHFQAARSKYPEGESVWGWDLALGLIAIRQGDRLEGEKTIRRLEQQKQAARAAGKPSNVSLRQAQLAAVLGERERAVEYLREWMVHESDAMALMSVKHSSDFEALRGYAPFETLVRPKG